MTERDFMYWLNGYLELSGTEILTKEQVKCIKDHMKLVMAQKTPTNLIGPLTTLIC